MENWTGVIELVTVVEQGSFTVAAKKLATSKSNISKKIKYLEDRLNVKLLYRSHQAISLTKAGEAYFKHCKKVVEEFSAIENYIRDSHQSLNGDINISLPAGLDGWLSPLMITFKKRHPNVNFYLNYTVNLVDLKGSSFDLAFRLAPHLAGDVVAKALIEKPYRLSVSKGFARNHRLPEHPGELERLPCLVYAESSQKSSIKWLFREPSSKQSLCVIPKLEIVSDSIVSLLAFARHDVGILYSSDFFVHQFLQTGELEPILQNWIHDTNTLWLIFPDRHTVTPRTRVFIDFVTDAIPNMSRFFTSQ